LTLDSYSATANGATPGYAGYASAYSKAITDATLPSGIAVLKDNSKE